MNEYTTVCPEGITLIPLLLLAKIQLGRSPVKKTPVYSVPCDGDVTNGMKARDIRFCSASTVFSVSSCLRISKTREATLINFTARKDVLEGVISSGNDAGRTSYIASCPERKKTWYHHLVNISNCIRMMQAHQKMRSR